MNELELFAATIAIADSGERASLLDRECADRPDLRQRLDQLLNAHFRSNPLLDQTGPGVATVSYHRLAAGAVIAGKYTLVEPIGEGGMGAVWRAKQTEPVKRFVAVKLIKPGMDSQQVLARFEAERQALAVMDHPNIAKVLDGGLHEGRPYFVMELVKGVPITDYCDANKFTPRQRLELFASVCQAIQHAHNKGIIHRDIKPSNVLIALYDDKPVVKVIDFGVAKATGGTLTEKTIDTGFGGVVGTPQYMSPEQATFNNLDIDTRSDVYALGVLLYELLTGSPPFSKKDLEQRGLLEMLRVIREQEPPRPSTKLSSADALPTLSANRGTEPTKLTGLLRNELDWIVMKALEKDRTRRYETANGFAADVLRYLNGEAVQAHPPSARYRLRKFARKHRPALTTTAGIALLLVAAVVVSAWQTVRARNAESAARDSARVAMAEADKAKKARDFIVSIFELSDSNGQRDILTARQLLDQAEKRIPSEFADQPELRAEVLAAIESVYAKITANSPLAMILESSGAVRLQSTRNVNQLAIPQTLLYTGDRLKLAADAHVQLVILSDLHKERLRPGTEATVRRKGCEPVDAISERADDIPMTFVHLPKATFYMGWGADGKGEFTTDKGFVRYLVTEGTKTEIKEDFEIAVHDVTQGQWQAVMGNNPSYFSRFGGGRNRVNDISDEELKLLPVESVTWIQAQEFINKLNERQRGSGWLYRLPTDAEWEYACRGGATSEEECSYHFYFAKPTNDAPKGPFLPRTTRVGAYPPNKLGLCDIQGNVSQWCSNELIDRGFGLMGQIIRGGAWNPASDSRPKPRILTATGVVADSAGYVGSQCRAGNRSALSTNSRSDGLGFRLVRARDRELAKRLPAMLRGEDKPADNVERVAFALLAYDHKKFAVATRLWTEALESDPTLGKDRQTQYRYDAASAASLAAAGQGQDEPALDDAAKAKLRRQALDWLNSELEVWDDFVAYRRVVPSRLVIANLSRWQEDSDLAGIRDATALAKLPPDEQKVFTQLWADVAQLLQEAEDPEATFFVPAMEALEVKEWVAAEQYLRLCLTIYEKKQPDGRRTSYTTSLLGAAILGQKRYAEAEPLLLAGYEGMKKRENSIPTQANTRIPKALDRLIKLYTATNKPDDAAKWRSERAKYPETVTVGGSGTASFFGRGGTGPQQRVTPKNVPVPLESPKPSERGSNEPR